MTTMTSSWLAPFLATSAFRASPVVLVTKAAGMVMFLRYLQVNNEQGWLRSMLHMMNDLQLQMVRGKMRKLLRNGQIIKMCAVHKQAIRQPATTSDLVENDAAGINAC